MSCDDVLLHGYLLDGNGPVTACCLLRPQASGASTPTARSKQSPLFESHLDATLRVIPKLVLVIGVYGPLTAILPDSCAIGFSVSNRNARVRAEAQSWSSPKLRRALLIAFKKKRFL